MRREQQDTSTTMDGDISSLDLNDSSVFEKPNEFMERFDDLRASFKDTQKPVLHVLDSEA